MRILAKEHLALRALARIVAMEAAQLRLYGRADLALLELIATYIVAFPDRIHHPKEEDYVFRLMRMRAPVRCNGVLDHLLAEHRQEADRIASFTAALLRYREGQKGADLQLAEVAGNYAVFLEQHIEFENTQAFVLAEDVLQEADWQEIDAAFASNDDPLVKVDPQSQFAELHRRIMALGAMPPGLK